MIVFEEDNFEGVAGTEDTEDGKDIGVLREVACVEVELATVNYQQMQLGFFVGKVAKLKIC